MSQQWTGIEKRKVKGRTRYKARIELPTVTLTGEPRETEREAAKDADWIRVKNGLEPKNGLVKRTKPKQ